MSIDCCNGDRIRAARGGSRCRGSRCGDVYLSQEAERRVVVTAPDGVEIVGGARGEGPALALVYGAMMDRSGWERLMPCLTGRTLFTYDRRGRGESGDASAHTIAAEVADLMAFVESLPEPRDLFGHSSGALLALHAVQRGLRVRRLVLYEPPLVSIREPRLAPELPAELEALLERGDRDAALERFLRVSMSQSDEDVVRLREGPRWAEQLGYIHTAPYDLRTALGFELDRQSLGRIDVPVLFLCGTESLSWMQRGVEAFAEAVPGSRFELLDGQRHNAQFSAPDVLAEAMNRFLD